MTVVQGIVAGRPESKSASREVLDPSAGGLTIPKYISSMSFGSMPDRRGVSSDMTEL